MKQTICDKCRKVLKVIKLTKKQQKEKDDFKEEMEDFFEAFEDEFPKERTEGSIIQIYLPKHNVINKVYDLCEPCTKVFLHTNIYDWLGIPRTKVKKRKKKK